MTEFDPLDRLSRVANQSEQPTPEFSDRLLTELLGDLADPSTNHITIHTGNEQTAEVVMLSPDRNHLLNRSRIGLLVAASVAAIALVGGLVVITNQNNPAAPADRPAPVSVPTVEPEPVPAVEPEPEVDAAPTFRTGATPYGMAFDGTSIWIANVNDNTVSKMNPENGTRVDYETGTLPRFVAFDGTSIWITNQRDGTVSKMNPDDGTRVDYPTGTSPDPNPHGVAFDGTSIWIANSADGTVSKMNPDDGTRIDYPTSADPFGVVSDGTSIWITNSDGTVSKMNPDDGTRVDYPTDASATLMAFDGTSIWITNPNDNTVSKMNPDDGTRVDYPTGTQPFGVTFDGTSIWITNEIDGTVSKMNPADGTRVDYPTGNTPRGVVSNGTNIWVANSTDNTVSVLTDAPQQTSAVTEAPEATETPAPTDPLEAFEPPAPIVLQGAGTQVVTLEDGSPESKDAFVVRATHDGASNFIVTLLDPAGEPLDGVVDAIGQYSGKRPWSFDDDDIVKSVEVEADGNWTLTLTAMNDYDNQSILLAESGSSYTGVGDDVIMTETKGPISFPDPIATDFVCSDCDSDIIVSSYGDSESDSLVNEIGEGVPFMTSFVLPSGTAVIVVETSGASGNPGNWTITLN